MKVNREKKAQRLVEYIAVGDFLSLANPVSYSEGVLHPIVRNSKLLNLLNPSLVCDDSDRPGQ